MAEANQIIGVVESVQRLVKSAAELSDENASLQQQNRELTAKLAKAEQDRVALVKVAAFDADKLKATLEHLIAAKLIEPAVMEKAAGLAQQDPNFVLGMMLKVANTVSTAEGVGYGSRKPAIDQGDVDGWDAFATGRPVVRRG
jgi:hypothetical protein